MIAIEAEWVMQQQEDQVRDIRFAQVYLGHSEDHKVRLPEVCIM